MSVAFVKSGYKSGYFPFAIYSVFWHQVDIVGNDEICVAPAFAPYKEKALDFNKLRAFSFLCVAVFRSINS